MGRITKEFHEDGVTPYDRLHPEDQAQINQLKDALAQMAEFNAGLKGAVVELKEHIVRPREFEVVRGLKGEIVGARSK